MVKTYHLVKIVVELSQVKIWKFGFLILTSFAETWCEMWDHVFKKSISGFILLVNHRFKRIMTLS